MKEDQGRISIPINAGLMVLLSLLLLVVPGVTVVTASILLALTVVLCGVFIAIVFDDTIALNGSRLALASGLVLICLILSFAGLFRAQSASTKHAFSMRLDRRGAVYFSIGVISDGDTNGVTARSSSARAAIALEQLIGLVVFALLIGGVVRGFGGRSGGGQREHGQTDPPGRRRRRPEHDPRGHRDGGGKPSRSPPT